MRKIKMSLAIILAAVVLVASMPFSVGAQEIGATSDEPVKQPIASALKLDRQTLNLGTGESYTFKTSFLPENAVEESVSFKSGNTKILSVNSEGKITAKASGAANVTAKSENGLADTCAVNVRPAPSSVSLSAKSVTLGIGETFEVTQIFNKGAYSLGTVWTSNRSDIASVKRASTRGKITALKQGTATITVKTHNNKTASCRVTVLPAPKSVSLNCTSTYLGKGEVLKLSASLNKGAGASAYSWKSSNSAVAAVKANGAGAEITAKSTGSAKITCSLYNGLTAECQIWVKAAPKSTKTEPSAVTLGKGESVLIKHVENDGAFARAYTFTSSNAKVATAAKAGGTKLKITAKAVGTANITLKTYNGKTAVCKVTVKEAPKKISLSEAKMTLGKGDSFKLSATSDGKSASYGYVWTSNRPDIVSVQSLGSGEVRVKGLINGTATVTAKSYNGKTAACKITVVNAPKSVKFKSSLTTLFKGESGRLYVSFNKNAFAKNVIYSSSDKSAVSLVRLSDGSCKITGKKACTVTITVKTYNNLTATCKVKILPDSKKIKNVPLVSQAGLPTGCETGACVMLMNYYGYNITTFKFADKYLICKPFTVKNGRFYAPDPNSAFVGSPYSRAAFGIYAPAMAKSMNKYLNGKKYKAVAIEGESLESLCKKYIANDQPVAIWASPHMSPTSKTVSWTVDYADENAKYKKGSTFTWTAGEHCLLLTGYDKDNYYFNDPGWNCRNSFSKSLVNKRFKEQGMQAVVMVKA